MYYELRKPNIVFGVTFLYFTVENLKKRHILTSFLTE